MSISLWHLHSCKTKHLNVIVSLLLRFRWGKISPKTHSNDQQQPCVGEGRRVQIRLISFRPIIELYVNLYNKEKRKRFIKFPQAQYPTLE